MTNITIVKLLYAFQFFEFFYAFYGFISYMVNIVAIYLLTASLSSVCFYESNLTNIVLHIVLYILRFNK